MNYNTNYTQNEIFNYLEQIKQCVNENRFVVLTKGESRQKNLDFINKYNLNSERQKSILLSLSVQDFCYSMLSVNENNYNHVLYVFAPQKNLFPFGFDESELVIIYIKMDYLNGNKVVMVSFHQAEKEITYCFK